MSKREKIAALKTVLGRRKRPIGRVAKLMIGPNERARSQYPTGGDDGTGGGDETK